MAYNCVTVTVLVFVFGLSLGRFGDYKNIPSRECVSGSSVNFIVYEMLNILRVKYIGFSKFFMWIALMP